MHLLASVVLVERLREVSALTGFTRIKSPAEFDDVFQHEAEHRVPLARKLPVFVPASEVRGEGIFLRFEEERVAQWAADCTAREDAFREALRRWRASRRLEGEGYFLGIRFVLLHSLAHALMRQLALECGYSAASLRERIYSREPEEDGGPMAGILIYTAAPDSEGTLGGLVSLGHPEQLGRHLEQALEQLRLCASDPLCADHEPGGGASAGGHGKLHGAACHACLLAPETSCEAGNRFLDRSVLVDTVADLPWAFFTPDGTRKRTR